MTNHEQARRFMLKQKVVGREIFKIRFRSNDTVELLEVLDTNNTGKLIIPSFIS